MRKLVLLFVFVIAVSIYSPRIVSGVTSTVLRVMDGTNQNPVAGAVVGLFTWNGQNVFYGTTDYNGSVYLDGMFNAFFYNQTHVTLNYTINKEDYDFRRGTQTFYRGQTHNLYIWPKIYCGDGVCSAGETIENCPADCHECRFCGDGICTSPENYSNCPEDCHGCGAKCPPMQQEGGDGY